MLRIGISGWRYAGWRGVFYPTGLPQRRELEYASRCFNSLEINGSFYSLQRPEAYSRWREQSTDDLVFALKGGRYITHMTRLKDPETPLANFFASGVLELAEKLGPILWQFGPHNRFDVQRFEQFFAILPRDTRAAAHLARRHADWMKGRVSTRCKVDLPLRYAVEVRHESFMSDRFIDLLREHGISLCIADSAGLYPYAEDITADFVYVRLHGAEELYSSGYSDEQLDWWAQRVRLWHEGPEPEDARRISSRKARRKRRDVYVYFDNDAKVHAPFDAARLASKLGLPPGHPPGEELEDTPESRRKS